MKKLRERGFFLIFPGMIILMLIGCVRVKVETAGAIKSLSQEIIHTGIPVGPTGNPQQYCQVLPFAQQSEVIHSLNVTKYTGIELPSKEVDEIFSEATKVAREGEGMDFPCRITLMRETAEDTIKDFQYHTASVKLGTDVTSMNECFGFGEICTEFDFNIMDALDPQGVKVVGEITWCGQPGTAAIGGCSNQPGHSMAVARFCTDGGCPKLEGVLWLHEFGHNKNLSHRQADDHDPGVMHQGINSAHLSLNACECQNLRVK